MTPTMFPDANTYIEAARPGNHEWWRYLLAVMVILSFWIGLGTLPTLVLVGWVFFQDRLQGITTFQLDLAELPMLPMFLAMMMSFVFLLIGLFLAVTLIHGRKFTSLVTPKPAINWRRLSQGFGVWFVLVFIISAVEALLYPGRYQFNFQPVQFMLFAVLGIVLIPLQTSTEELLFRGYLIQALGLKLRSPWVLILISGFSFGLLHLGNPEVSTNFWMMGAYYIVIGVFLAFVTLRDGTLELALGLHAANNLFSALFAAYPDGALRTPGLFSINVIDPVYNLAALIVALLVFAGILLRSKNSRQTLS